MPTDQFAQMDPLYFCILGPAILIMLFAQWRVKSTYEQWSKVRTQSSVSGVDVAQRLLSQNVNQGVSIDRVQGQLTDYYNPQDNSLHISESNIGSVSVASMAVVAHEVGHAQQDATGSMLMKVRSGIVPIVNIGAQFGPILFMAGLASAIDILMWIGILLFSLAFVFALVTLPVELDASRRALQMLDQSNLLGNEEEKRGAQQVCGGGSDVRRRNADGVIQVIYHISLRAAEERMCDAQVLAERPIK
jgi:Zn-dependent membrane protease YugP